MRQKLANYKMSSLWNVFFYLQFLRHYADLHFFNNSIVRENEEKETVFINNKLLNVREPFETM